MQLRNLLQLLLLLPRCRIRVVGVRFLLLAVVVGQIVLVNNVDHRGLLLGEKVVQEVSQILFQIRHPLFREQLFQSAVLLDIGYVGQCVVLKKFRDLRKLRTLVFKIKLEVFHALLIYSVALFEQRVDIIDEKINLDVELKLNSCHVLHLDAVGEIAVPPGEEKVSLPMIECIYEFLNKVKFLANFLLVHLLQVFLKYLHGFYHSVPQKVFMYDVIDVVRLGVGGGLLHLHLLMLWLGGFDQLLL